MVEKNGEMTLRPADLDTLSAMGGVGAGRAAGCMDSLRRLFLSLKPFEAGCIWPDHSFPGSMFRLGSYHAAALFFLNAGPTSAYVVA